MATFLVVRRLKRADGVHMPNELLDLDPLERETQILHGRGYITPVPGDFLSASTGETEPGPETAEDLLKHTRDELNEMASDLGVEGPEALSNKAAVVEAILAVRAESEELAELLTHTRAELDETAAALGIDNPGTLPNKKAVAEVILAARAEDEADAESEDEDEDDDG